MQTYKVRITRTETYVRDVDVVAANWDEAVEKAKENEEENEYADLFDCPDDVQTEFGKTEEDPTLIPPCKGLNVRVLTEVDGVDEWWEKFYSADELANAKVIDKRDPRVAQWNLKEGELWELASDDATDAALSAGHKEALARDYTYEIVYS